ncbi:MAG: hypothetical protein HFE47_06070 [Clostridia bacterium]|nr:hypothetical protein [Clostridia bacterium]
MAKKVVQSDSKGKAPVKKKRHGCRNCLITMLVIFVVVGVGVYFTGNYFTQRYLDMSLANCFGVLYDLRSANSKKIVTNSYGDKDYDSFNTELKKQLFLNDQADFGVETLLAALTAKEEGGSEAEGVNVSARNDYLSQSVDALGASLNTSGLLDELSELYVRENLDLARLRDYDPTRHKTAYVMQVTDRMLAAAVNGSLDEVCASVDSVQKMLNDYKIAKLSDVARLDQLIFGERQGTKNGESATVKTVTATVSVNVRKVARSYLKDATGKDLGFLLNMVLPKRLYATVVVPVEEGASVENNIYVNNMTDKKMNRAYKLIAGITELTGERMDVKEKISSAMSGSVGNTVRKVNDVFPIADAVKNTVSFDVFETVIDLSGLNKTDGELKPESEQLHAPDIIQTLGGVVASDADNAVKEEYDYQHQWFDSTQNKVVYNKTLDPNTQYPDMTWQNYWDLFMQELAEKYMLDLSGKDPDDPSDDVTFETLMRLFGLGEPLEGAAETELLDLFDTSKLGNVLDSPNRKVNVDSRMLGAILQAQIDTLIDGAGSLGDCKPSLAYVYTYTTQNHKMLQAAISVDIGGLVAGKSGIASIVTGLIGDTAVITFDIDVTPGLPDENAFASKLIYNDLTAEKTAVILKTVSSFASDFDTAGLLSQVEKPIRDAIDKMNSVIPVELCDSTIDLDATVENADLPAAIELPSVFETIKFMLFKNDDAEKGEINQQITAQGIEDVLRAINAVNDENFESLYIGQDGISMAPGADGNLAPTYGKSFAEILEKYYIVNTGANGETLYTQFDDLFASGGVANFQTFDVANFDFNKLYHDPRAIVSENGDDLRPVFEDNDLAALLVEKMRGESGIYGDLTGIKGLRIDTQNGAKTLTIMIQIDVSKLIGSDETAAEWARLLPAETVYLKAAVDLSHIAYYDKNGEGKTVYDSIDEIPEGEKQTSRPFYRTTLTINRMDEMAAETGRNVYGTMLNMMKSLGGNADALDLDVKARDIGAIICSQIETLESSLGGNIEFVNGGVRLVSVYDFLKKALKSDADTEDIKAALQGLAATKDGEENSTHNYKTSELLVNGISDEVLALALGETTKKDNEFGSILANGFTVSALGQEHKVSGVLAQGEDGAFGLCQLNILHQSLGEREPFVKGFVTENSQQELADTFADITGKTFIEFTFRASMDKLLQTEGENPLASAVPKELYVTILLEKTATGYKEVYFRINGLNDDVQKVLLSLVKIEQAEITAQIDKCMAALNAYTGATFDSVTPYAGDAFGTITFTQGNIGM